MALRPNDVAIAPGDVFERNGWDYIENNCWYGGSSQLPLTFGGVSGGPVWGLKLRRDESNGQFSLINYALIGILFCETPIQNEERRLRGHFIKSIYDIAWKNVT